MPGNKILVVLTNTTPSDHPFSGVDVTELANLYAAAEAHTSHEHIVLASPKGGAVALNTKETLVKGDAVARKFAESTQKMDLLRNTARLDALNAADYRMAVFVGGPGALFDVIPAVEQSAALFQQIYMARGILAAIGHGVGPLVSIPAEQADRRLVAGKNITGATADEDATAKYADQLPVSVEETARRNGARFVAAKPFHPKVVVDAKIITAQNIQSTADWTNALFRDE